MAKKKKSNARVKTAFGDERQLYTIYKALEWYQYLLKKELKMAGTTRPRKKEIKGGINRTMIIGTRILIKLSKYANDTVIKGVCNKVLDDCIERMNSEYLKAEETKSLQQVPSAEGL
ncbi:MAG: hypothetical protein HF314_12165 [Ignavibacteria bacterium]|jgi:hypothetical protein|nr:hypothetical protein [Ignavibacteria bacterium]MCU7503826.1 hypothetical protein [Ignavibacteria bacterium]MCU7517160.1 hypothetical protein [Ignavibacteria bacterium]